MEWIAYGISDSELGVGMISKSSKYGKKLLILVSCLTSAISAISSSPALSETGKSPKSEDLIFGAEGPLEPGHLTFRVKFTPSEALEIGGKQYAGYEVQRYGQNCSAAIVKDAMGSGNYVGWTSKNESEQYYGQTSQEYPEPIYYYRIDIENNTLDRKMIGRLDLSGNLKTDEFEHIKLVRIDKPWAQVWELIRYNVC